MQHTHILYFDGECIFCDSWIRILYKLDKNKKLLFCALQAEQAKKDIGPDLTKSLHTIVLREQKTNKIYLKSSAVLRALALACPILKLILIFLILPSSFRDLVYDFVAKYRYKLFGKKELCAVDSSLDRSRFIVK